jgi:integrase
MPSPKKSPAAVVRRVRKRLADGTVREYVYHGPPTRRARPSPIPADSLRDLIAAYERSPEWTALAERTRRNRIIALRHLAKIHHLPVSGLKRRDILTLRDAIAAGIGPGAGNAFASALATLLSWARDRGWIEHSPADRIRAIPGGHFPAWSESDLARALDVAPSPIRRALLLAVHTGQRRGDLVAATWTAMTGGVWRLTQQKTGTRLVIPLHPDLQTEMATWPRTAVTVLTQADGTPWTPDALTMATMRALEPTGMKGHNIHGLRALAATRLAEAGCTAHEIAAITGHASLAQVALYTRTADQERLARAAVTRLETATRKPRETG